MREAWVGYGSLRAAEQLTLRSADRIHEHERIQPRAERFEQKIPFVDPEPRTTTGVLGYLAGRAGREIDHDNRPERSRSGHLPTRRTSLSSRTCRSRTQGA